MNRIFLMKAKPHNKRTSFGGWFLSEKLDGMRAFWDGGITRGMPVQDIPWANTERAGANYISTGLWSNYANVIHAPDWWLDQLPRMMLDGELWGDLPRQDILSKVRALHGDWMGVQYHVLDTPSMLVYADGRIHLPNYHYTFDSVHRWVSKHVQNLEYVAPNCTIFKTIVQILRDKVQENEVVHIHPQTQLPFQTDKANDLVNQALEEITSKGGEGVVLRKAESYWKPMRSDDVLKIKKLDDAEGKVVGYITGRRTTLGSKLLGKMGALVLDLVAPLSGRLELSGFTDAERELSPEAREHALKNPGCFVNGDTMHFVIGDIVTFRYRGLTKDGIPQEARYWRQRNDI